MQYHAKSLKVLTEIVADIHIYTICSFHVISQKRVLEELSEHDVLVEQLGGDVQAVNISALQGNGIFLS